MLKLNNIEEETKKTEEFARENDISMDEIDKLYDEVYETLDEDLSEKQKQIRSIRKVRGLLRRKIQYKGEEAEGIIIGRYRNSNYNQYAYRKAEEYVEKHGIEQAKIDGYVNDNGQYIHTVGFSKGEVINPKDVYGNAVGLFKNENGQPEPHLISIGSYQIDSYIPLGQEIKMGYKEAKTNGKIFKNNKMYYLNNTTVIDNSMYTESDLIQYINVINEIFGEEFNSEQIIFEEYDDMIEFAKTVADNKFNIMGLIGEVIDLGISKDPEKRIPITFESGLDSFSFWSEPEVFRGLNIQDGLTGVIFLNAYKGKEDNVGFNVAGFMPLSDE